MLFDDSILASETLPGRVSKRLLRLLVPTNATLDCHPAVLCRHHTQATTTAATPARIAHPLLRLPSPSPRPPAATRSPPSPTSAAASSPWRPAPPSPAPAATLTPRSAPCRGHPWPARTSLAPSHSSCSTALARLSQRSSQRWTQRLAASTSRLAPPAACLTSRPNGSSRAPLHRPPPPPPRLLLRRHQRRRPPLHPLLPPRPCRGWRRCRSVASSPAGARRALGACSARERRAGLPQRQSQYAATVPQPQTGTLGRQRRNGDFIEPTPSQHEMILYIHHRAHHSPSSQHIYCVSASHQNCT